MPRVPYLMKAKISCKADRWNSRFCGNSRVTNEELCNRHVCRELNENEFQRLAAVNVASGQGFCAKIKSPGAGADMQLKIKNSLVLALTSARIWGQ